MTNNGGSSDDSKVSMGVNHCPVRGADSTIKRNGLAAANFDTSNLSTDGARFVLWWWFGWIFR